MSLQIAAPISVHSLMTLDRKLSIEILQFGKVFKTKWTIGVMRCSSSSSETKFAPGREL